MPFLCWFCFALPATANPPVIGWEGSWGKKAYIGESLEILSEGEVFDKLEQTRALPEEFRRVILSGRMGSDPNILVDLQRTRQGYQARMRRLDSGEERLFRWGIEDVLKEEVSGHFKASEKEIPVLDFTDHAYWLRFRFHNPGPEPLDVILELDKTSYSWFDLMQPQEGGFVLLEGAYEAPMSRRVIKESKVLFPLELLPGAQDIYIRVESRLIDTIPIRLWTAEKFHRHNNIVKFTHGCVSGATLLLLIYALFAAVSLREKGFLYLALLIAAGYLVHLSASGLGMTFFWPEHPMASVAVFSLALPLTIVVNLLFCRHYLDVQKQTPLADRILSVLLYTAGLLGIAQFFVPLHSRFLFSGIAIGLDYFSVAPLIYAAVVSVFRGKKGRRPALYMLVAISFQLFSYVEYWLSLFNIIPLGLIDFLHIRSVGFVLVMLWGVRFKMRLLEETIRTLRSELKEIIEKKTKDSLPKVLTDKTLIKVEAVRDFIGRHFTDPLYRDDLAASVDMSRDHLGRMFKRLTGEKISDYINRLRVEEACKRLKESDRKIIDIAFDVGFENLRTFNLCFANLVGASPSAYRKNP